MRLSRRFATPLVLTIATTACPGPRLTNPPPPEFRNADAGVADAAPVALDAAPVVETPAPDPVQRFVIDRKKGACAMREQVVCRKAEPGQETPTCNPPAPYRVACPPMSEDSVVVTKRGDTCIETPMPVNCPPNVPCNPPPPKEYPCPKPL